jgi:hypothetical protein
MARTEKLEIFGLSNDYIAYAEAMGLSNVFEAYAENSAEADAIMEIGFNPNSGYVYIALENGISIVSMLGRGVEYLVSDLNNGEEYFFDTYDEALDNLDFINDGFDDDFEADFEDWMDDGNVEEIEPGVYATQDANFINRIKGIENLKKYFQKEFR